MQSESSGVCWLHLLAANLNNRGNPGGSVKNLPASAKDARDMGSMPGEGSSSGVGNGNSFQYSCLETSVDTGA